MFNLFKQKEATLFNGKKVKEGDKITLQQDDVMHPSFWFMRDNHTFIKLKGKNAKEVKQHALEVAKENAYGMICPVRILQGEKELHSVGECCHVDKDGNVDLKKWWDDIMKEDCVRCYDGA